MVDMRRGHGAGHSRVVGGGGGTITPEEIREREAYGVGRIYHPNDGMKLGLVEMIADVVRRVSGARDLGLGIRDSVEGQAPSIADEIALGRVLSAIDDGVFSAAELAPLRQSWAHPRPLDSPLPHPQSRPTPPVAGTTGPGQLGRPSFRLRSC